MPDMSLSPLNEGARGISSGLTDSRDRGRLRRWGGPLSVTLLGLGLYLPGLGWGLPTTVSWSQDTIAGVRTLGAVEGWPGEWHGRYPPLHYLVLAAVYQPVLQYWEGTGELVLDDATGRTHFQPSEASKIGLLITIARVVSVVMAIAAGLGLWAAVRLLTGDGLAAWLATVTFMIGAAFTYFAHLGSVDVPATCWFAWSVYFFARLLGSGRWSDALLLGLFGSLAISTKDSIAGVYPGMALVLLVVETAGRMRNASFGSALVRTLFQFKWLLGIAAFAVPYLALYGAFTDPEAYLARMRYWLAPAADTLHARQYRYPNQYRLLGATIHYTAAAVGWPMLGTLGASAIYAVWRHRRIAAIVLVPAVTYYLIVIAQIDFVYSRFLFAPIALGCILVGLTGADWWRREGWPAELRLGIPGILLLLSLGYAVAINAAMVTDSRYDAERWFVGHVERQASVGAFSKPQYLPRLHELGYATYQVDMSRESFDQPQPDYLVLSSYNYEDFDQTQKVCMGELLAGHLGYTPVVTFGSRYLGTGSCWLSIAGWGTPPPGKISPTITVLQRKVH